MEKDQWKACWIWKPGEVQTSDYGLFRKTFRLAEKPAAAKLHVSAHHVMHVYLNGERISGYGSPAPSNPPRTKLYLTYDITSLLGGGEHTISAVVHYLAGGGQNRVDGHPGFICQLETAAADGTVSMIVSDESWEVCGQSPYQSGTEFQQSRRISSIERYDGGTAESTRRWLAGEHAQDSPVIHAVRSAIESEYPSWVLKAQEMPEGREECAIRPEACGIQRIGHQVFDAGRVVSGWVRVKLRGAADTVVRVRYSEQLDDSGAASRFVANERSDTYYDEYRMAGVAEETWQPDFSYKAFRYFEVTGYPDWVGPEDVMVVAAHTPLGSEGDFACSDPLLNAMFSACMVTQKNNVLGQVVDCPHREQAQYLADSDLQAETLACFFEARPILRKVLSDFTDVQLPDGSFPFVSPGSFDRPEFHIQIPEWDLHFVSLLWKIYFTYHDMESVRDFYPAAVRLMEGYLAQTCPDTGLIRKSDRWHISDWPYPRVDQEGPYLTVQNAKCYGALNTMSRLASLLGRTEESERYARAAPVARRRDARASL